MFNHRKRLFYPIHTEKPDPEFARLLLDGYGGRDGELTSVIQYLNRRAQTNNRYVRELYGLIAAEELSHMEIIGAAISKLEGQLEITNSIGKAWRAGYIRTAPDPIERLEIDLDTERRARALYIKLMSLTDDPGMKKMLNFLIGREEIHHKLLSKAKKILENEVDQDQINLIYEYRMSLQVLE